MNKKGYGVDWLFIFLILVVMAGYWLVHSNYEFFVLGCQSENDIPNYYHCLPQDYPHVQVYFVLNLLASIVCLIGGIYGIFRIMKKNKDMEDLRKKVASFKKDK